MPQTTDAATRIWTCSVLCAVGLSACQPDEPVQGPPLATGLEPLAPANPALRRLTRVEFQRSLHDLLGTTLPLADRLPEDDQGQGFDNDASLLHMTSQHVELHAQAVELAVADVLFPKAAAHFEAVQAELADLKVGAIFGDSLWRLSHYDAAAVVSLLAAEAGDWRLVLHAGGHRDHGPPLRAAILVNGQPRGIVHVGAPPGRMERYEIAAGFLQPGKVLVSIEYLDDPAPTPSNRDLLLDWIAIEGPLRDPALLEARKRALLPCAAETPACVRDVLARLARRAWRRPVHAAELARLEAVATLAQQRGVAAEPALALAFQAVLTSPHFLLRVETDPPSAQAVAHDVTPHELATRLAYFLWSTLPDDTLSELADAGHLGEPAVLQAEVDRMLADPKAVALTDGFAEQWLPIRALAAVQPAAATFPEFDAALRAAMVAESRLLFTELLHQDRPLAELLTADTAFLDDRLAVHYGLPVTGSVGPVRRALPANRRGVLGQGAVLTATSRSDRTSPTLRGKWVLARLLCEPPAPPPPGVVELASDPAATLREQMARHRVDPACSGCHAAMDPIGLALEPFDAIGAWRSHDQGLSIVAHGQLPDGRTFADAVDLGVLLSHDRRFVRCVTRQMVSYALGRSLDGADDPWLDAIEPALREGNGTLRSLVHATVRSPLFRQRTHGGH